MFNTLRRLCGLFPVADIAVPYEILGKECAWATRTDSLRKDSVIYSFGAGMDISWDIALIERTGAVVHAFDPTPKSIAWIREQNTPAEFRFCPYGIAATDGIKTFYAPYKEKNVSHSVIPRGTTAFNFPVKTLRTIMQELGHDRIDLLKMDIEGSEYEVINDLIASGARPIQLLVEFHHRFDGVGMRKTMRAIKRLKKAEYKVFYVSPTGEDVCFTL